jgi:GT2 family glycosyltransferase
VYADGRPQAAAFRFPGLRQIFLDLFPVPRLTDSAFNGRVHATHPIQIDHPLGACMLIRRAAWEAVGPLDEGYFMYLEEVDWCRRARAHGWQVWYQPHATVTHHAGAATRQRPAAMFAQLWRSRLRYYQRFHGPLYNRLVHALVRYGVRAPAASSVRQLTS